MDENRDENRNENGNPNKDENRHEKSILYPKAHQINIIKTQKLSLNGIAQCIPTRRDIVHLKI